MELSSTDMVGNAEKEISYQTRVSVAYSKRKSIDPARPVASGKVPRYT